MTRKTETVAHLDASIARWKTRLKRSVTMIDKLEKKRRRLAAKALVSAAFDPILEKIVEVPVQASLPAHPTVDSETTLGTGPAFEPTPLGPTGPSGPQCLGAVGVPGPDPDAHLDIPPFLRRDQAEVLTKAADKLAADQLREEQAATKKAKAQGRIAKLKAKKSGELKKMPLSGKAALDAIRNG